MKRLILIAMVVLMTSSIAVAQTTTTQPTTTTAQVTTTTAPVTTTTAQVTTTTAQVTTTIPVTGQDFCKGDFDYNGNVDADDVTTFLAHFGRNPFNDPCPPDGPAPVAKTGQSTCYDEDGFQRDCEGTGEDGEYQSGLAWPNPRFTNNGDGTVSDNLTGLIWLRDAQCAHTIGHDPDTTGNGSMTWQHALDFVAGINDGTYPLCGSGYNDWRLPNIKELFSLVHDAYSNPSLPNTAGTEQWLEGDPFDNVISSHYWSSTTLIPYYTGYAREVDFGDGYAYRNEKWYTYYVWPVRGGH